MVSDFGERTKDFWQVRKCGHVLIVTDTICDYLSPIKIDANCSDSAVDGFTVKNPDNGTWMCS